QGPMPGGYAPMPGGNVPYGAPPPQQQQGMNGFAIASLIFGVIGGCFLSVIFGVVALNQIKKRGQRGRGLAIAGLVLSAIWVVVVVIGVVVSAGSSGHRDSAGEVDKGGSQSVGKLRDGDCV